MSKLNVKPPSLKRRFTIKELFLSQYFILILSLVIFGLMTIINPKIAGSRSLTNMLNNLLPLFIMAVGQMFVLIVAGIDLAQPSIVGLTSVLGAVLMTNSVNEARFGSSVLWGTVLGPDGGPLANTAAAVPVAIIVMLLVGMSVGLLSGLFITKFKMAPFMVTLVFQQLFLYLAIWLTQSFNIIGLPESFINIGRKGIGVIPYALIIAAVVGVGHIC